MNSLVRSWQVSWRKVKQGREQGCWRAAGPSPRGERPRPLGWRPRPSCLARSRGPRPAPGVWRSRTLRGAARRGRLVPVHGGRRGPGSRVPSTLAAGSRGARCGDVCFPFASSFHKRRDPAGASGTQRAPRPPPESNGAPRLPSMPRRPKQGALLSPRLSPVGFVFSQVTAGVSVLFLPSKGVYLIFKN